MEGNRWHMFRIYASYGRYDIPPVSLLCLGSELLRLLRSILKCCLLYLFIFLFLSICSYSFSVSTRKTMSGNSSMSTFSVWVMFLIWIHVNMEILWCKMKSHQTLFVKPFWQATSLESYLEAHRSAPLTKLPLCSLKKRGAMESSCFSTAWSFQGPSAGRYTAVSQYCQVHLSVTLQVYYALYC